MSKIWSDQAIVLRTFNVGESDRFCILLTENYGRVAARGSGVRRMKSRRAAGLMPLHRIHLTCELRSAGLTISAVTCLDNYSNSWRDPETFFCAEHGIETVLKLTEEGTPLPEIYALTNIFLRACKKPDSRITVTLFQLKLLSILGSLPSATHSAVSHLPFKPGEPIVLSRFGGLSLKAEEKSGMRVSPELSSIIAGVGEMDLQNPPVMPKPILKELERFVQGLLGSQLGVELKSPRVGLAMSELVRPI